MTKTPSPTVLQYDYYTKVITSLRTGRLHEGESSDGGSLLLYLLSSWQFPCLIPGTCRSTRTRLCSRTLTFGTRVLSGPCWSFWSRQSTLFTIRRKRGRHGVVLKQDNHSLMLEGVKTGVPGWSRGSSAGPIMSRERAKRLWRKFGRDPKGSCGKRGRRMRMLARVPVEFPLGGITGLTGQSL
jgi:hypothetical protein